MEGSQTEDFLPHHLSHEHRTGNMSVIFRLMASESEKGKLSQTVANYAVIGLVIVCMTGILYVFLSQGQRIIEKIGPVGNLIIKNW
ncbi:MULTISPECIES: hypothetical protein [Bacteroides]|jgi:multiple antibiotic resistance protein|uniref:Transmembrane protein n=1 Tax=Bacteroides fragilis TaxID=817 RepID=A0A4P8MPG6_BACFG|nr:MULTISPECIES: hypothetical protein [Bacteroides]MBC5611562.1 hypothetical protein [Bacteroides hominis (ex Liu et al. 2022)]MBV4156078.1 hypothetical protein [Bacteroides fragilis]MCE8568965.1 hypothetical protein [Bacteroides fragilis]MCE8581693.1 hypothetical protein [Bacteroides fragilis]MCE8650343.1 hypothetical protein [Bacteroides fragilis]